ncbi:hypothetical protein [Sinomonas sp. ASV322]|uniref:hypothetical protein n=1 Tax=Sinomonas sp. ASV322 TaxID=3041920 RepID=UPI0027DBF6E6|nr:hypothetical protein [Sinomonas sp. ASV322]MDQ4502542.1 hypothetical protein [Sinomonas sp. ASV322]
MAEETSGVRYDGKSELVALFLSIHHQLTQVIHAICISKGPDAYKNHAADALECLISQDPSALAPLDHLLALRIQEYIGLFGPMTFVRAVAAEYGLDYIVDEYWSWKTGSRGRNRETAT